MSEKPIIWESSFARSNPEYKAGVDFTPYPPDAPLEVQSAFSKVLHRMYAGKPVEREELPDHLFVDETLKKIPKAGLPDFFQASNLRVISETARTLLEAFDTGATRFHETRILGDDGETWLEGSWFILNWVADQDCFVPEETFQERISRIGKTDLYRASWEPSLDDEGVQLIAIRPPNCAPDLWADVKLSDALFFSDRLVRAIHASKLRGGLAFTPCKVIT